MPCTGKFQRKVHTIAGELQTQINELIKSEDIFEGIKVNRGSPRFNPGR